MVGVFLTVLYRMAWDDFSGYNHYEVLCLDLSPSKQDIKKAFRVASLKHHPDKSSSHLSAIRFQRLSEAYTTLMDDQKRAEYKSFLIHERQKRSNHRTINTKQRWWGVHVWLRQQITFHGMFQFVVLLGIFCIGIEVVRSGWFHLVSMATPTQEAPPQDHAEALRKARLRQQARFGKFRSKPAEPQPPEEPKVVNRALAMQRARIQQQAKYEADIRARGRRN